MTDLLGGHMDMAFMGLPQCVQQIKAGKLRALGVSTAKRSSRYLMCRRWLRRDCRTTLTVDGSSSSDPPICLRPLPATE